MYEVRDFRSFRDTDKGPELMANFVAWITREVRYVDGMTSATVLTLEGQMPPAEGETEPTQLPAVDVPADEFASLQWVMREWGTRCVILPGSSIKDDLRTMIQMRSKPEVKTVYKHTGWTTIGGKQTYLHVGGGITARGNDPSVTVRLPHELSRYDLRCEHEPKASIAASLAMLEVTRHELTWPLLAATLTPLYGPVDFAVHVTGRTGSFKSELLSLFQSHYGAGMDARHLPGSWSSTGNAMEALCYYACNAAFVLDDFVPHGTTWQQRAYQACADKIIRAQGNQAGRARLTDTAAFQGSMYPRGIILSTGEDTPEGHSVRARMLILEIAAGDIDTEDLSEAQSLRGYYPGTVAWLAQSLAAKPGDIRARTEDLRAKYQGTGHSRTPGMLGRLVATAEDFLARAAGAGLLSAKEQARHAQTARAAIEHAGGRQQSYLEDADPVDVFSAALRQVLGSGGGHIRTINGGTPRNAELLGWTTERTVGEIVTFKARGPTIGWCKTDEDELYFDVTSGYNIVRKAAGADLALSKQTLFKRMKDAGALLRVDDARNRNTVRVTAENHPRQVLVFSLSAILDIKESTGNDEDLPDAIEE